MTMPAKMWRDMQDTVLPCFSISSATRTSLGLVEVADLLVVDELQFGLIQTELGHDGQRMVEIAADAVGDDTQFHCEVPLL